MLQDLTLFHQGLLKEIPHDDNRNFLESVAISFNRPTDYVQIFFKPQAEQLLDWIREGPELFSLQEIQTLIKVSPAVLKLSSADKRQLLGKINQVYANWFLDLTY